MKAPVALLHDTRYERLLATDLGSRRVVGLTVWGMPGMRLE